ncbi:hypothetical protein D3C87_1835610 [compost metagenome]
MIAFSGTFKVSIKNFFISNASLYFVLKGCTRPPETRMNGDNPSKYRNAATRQRSIPPSLNARSCVSGPAPGTSIMVYLNLFQSIFFARSKAALLTVEAIGS